MRSSHSIPVFVIALVLTISCAGRSLAAQTVKSGPYQPTTESLRTHKVPQWFEEAKFGIFIHFGIAVFIEHAEIKRPRCNIAQVAGIFKELKRLLLRYREDLGCRQLVRQDTGPFDIQVKVLWHKFRHSS